MTDLEKRLLWAFLQTHHKSLATLLTLARKREETDVRISGHPPATEEWIRSSIAQWNPSFAQGLEDDVDPILSGFRGSELRMSTVDLVAALLISLSCNH